MGSSRSLEQYLLIVGLNMNTKEVTYTGWFETGFPPHTSQKYDILYDQVAPKNAVKSNVMSS